MQCRVWKGGTSHLVYELGKYSNHFRITPISDYFKQPCSPPFLNLGNARVYMYMCIYTYIYIYIYIYIYGNCLKPSLKHNKENAGLTNIRSYE